MGAGAPGTGAYNITSGRCDMPYKNKEDHNAYMRAWRKTHPMNAEQKRKDSCRSYLGVYLRRGKIQRQPCELCGAPAEAHHHDYSKPLEVRWLCRPHHLELHKAEERS